MDAQAGTPLTKDIREYWNEHVHDLNVATHPVGSDGFFKDLERYRLEKQRYLPRVVDFSGYRDKRLLEVGCGVGLDLIRFARAGADVTGIDLSDRAIRLAQRNFQFHGLKPTLRIMDGEHLGFRADEFDAVYAHGVMPYTGDIRRMIHEIYRVLKPGGEAILQVFNRHSWLYLLSKCMRVKLEHQDAPAFHTHTPAEFKGMLQVFEQSRIIIERFPVRTRLHRGLKGLLYNSLFVDLFNAIPRPLVQRFGWHMIARATK